MSHSLLDEDLEQIVSNNIENSAFSREATARNAYREVLPIEDYIACLSIYTEVMQSYARFFVEYWYRDDVETTNRKMIEELERCGIKGWAGLTEEENNPLGEYVLTLDCPATTTQIREFFERVTMGDLEFRCRYPIGDSDAFEMIKDYLAIINKPNSQQ